MLFEEMSLAGAYIITLQPKEDERGFFARSFCKQLFSEKGLHSDFVQCNVSYNHKKGTLRGLHYQQAPFGEVKIVTCHRGAIYDVIVDMRIDSPTYRKWIGVELTSHNHQSLYIPEGFAHGFQTLADETEVFYHMGNYYHPHAAQGIRWDDPALAINWPEEVQMMSQADKQYPLLTL